MGLAGFYVGCGLLLVLCAMGAVPPVAIVRAVWLQGALIVCGLGLCAVAARGIVRRKRNTPLDQVTQVRQRRLQLHGYGLLALCALLLLLALAPGSLDGAVQMSGLGRGVFGVMAVAFGLLGVVYQLSPTKLHAKAELARGGGIVGRAEIVSIKDTRSTLNEDPSVELQLSIQLPGRDPFERIFTGFCPRLAVGRLVVGGTLAVRVDGNDDTSFDIDWMHQAD